MTLTTADLTPAAAAPDRWLRVRACRHVGVAAWTVRGLQDGEGLEPGREYEMLESAAQSLLARSVVVLV